MSFSWLGNFREGQWSDFRKFILEERKDVEKRLNVITAELRRIGEIVVRYSDEEVAEPTVDGKVQTSVKVSEKRLGLSVTPGSSLEKLLKAYTAQGGNPLDISMFLQPDRGAFQGGSADDQNPDLTSENLIGYTGLYPHDGIIAPKTPTVFNPTGGVYDGGHLTLGKDRESEMGGVLDSDINQTLTFRVDHAKRWCQQEITTKRNNLEAKIIKLMDLREQLMQERDEILVQATGGSITGSTTVPDPDQYHPDMHVTAIVSDIDKIIWKEAETGGVDVSERSSNRFNFPTIFKDKDGDTNTAL